MLVLIDGSNLAYRSLHASFNDLRYYSHLEAASYFLKRLSSYLEFHNLGAGCIIAWDQGIPLHRRNLYPEYKPHSTPVGEVDNRFFSKINLGLEEVSVESTKNNPEFFSEYSKLIKMLHPLMADCNCISVRIPNVEADDIIAYSCFCLPEVEKQIISSDRDLLQLITPYTSVYNFASSNIQGKIFDYEWVENNYEDPDLFREYFLLEKAILGDTSDNIPGIEFIGDKTSKRYVDSIMWNRKNKMSLNESLYHVEKPPRASKKGHENLRLSSDLIKRNLDLMDLYFPIHTQMDMVYLIKKELVSFLNLEIIYDDSLDKLENQMGYEFNKCYSSIDKIFESNCNFNTKEVLKEIRDFV